MRPAPSQLVVELATELVPALVEDGSVEAGFGADVASDVGDACLNLLNASLGLLPIVAERGLAAHGLLRLTHLLPIGHQFLFEGLKAFHKAPLAVYISRIIGRLRYPTPALKVRGMSRFWSVQCRCNCPFASSNA